MSPADVTTWDSCTGRTADAYEGLNEWDTAHPATDGNWAQTDASVQQWLYSAVRSTGGVTVVAPSLTSESAYATVGPVEATSDVGNAHVYFAGRNPGTSGWGGGDAFGVYGALGYDLAIARQPTGSKPMYVTESGYGDAPGTSYAVPPATKARYLLRTLLENWNAGVARTYVYELVDNGGGDFGSYGLTDGGGTIKPAYTAVKNLLAHLSDPGTSILPGSLAYTLAAPAQVHHALFQKRDRSFVLALWLEVPEWDPSANRSVAVTPQATLLTFGRSPSSLRTTAFDDGGNVTTRTVAPAGVLTIPVGASPALLDVTP
ncbi:MAG: Ricin lectin [Candidatus Eremiobacteraeota bacterium]|nr:Ricin lectin [Candidatus Eremiobacteraeota bacterium]